MNPLQQLTPAQRKLALGGAVAVALLVLWQRLRGTAPASSEAPPAAPPAGTMPGGTADTTAIDSGALASWTETFTDALSGLAGRLTDLEQRPTTTPNPGTTGNPLAPSLVPKSQLGRRQTTSRNVQPPGRAFPGETMGEIARRVYGDRGYWNFVRFFNPGAWPGSPDKAVRAGTVIYY